MSFQAYLDTIEDRTGKTPRALVEEAGARGLGGPDAKAGPVIAWLKDDYGLGRGHAMALFSVIRNGTTISSKHVGTSGVHRDESDTLWIDGRATNPGTAKKPAK